MELWEGSKVAVRKAADRDKGEAERRRQLREWEVRHHERKMVGFKNLGIARIFSQLKYWYSTA